MTALGHPAVVAFLAELGEELVMAEVLIRRRERRFELRHVRDLHAAAETLRPTAVADLRRLAELTDAGAFRPLKSAPTLPAGWLCSPANEGELEAALRHLYPGALADWFAARTGPLPVTHYREFTGRQTGMYRVTTMLDDAQAGRMIRACCGARVCLKHRHWTVEGLEPDAPETKSIIPCLEPCAVLLEFARKAARLEQEEFVQVSFPVSDVDVLRATLEAGLQPATEKVPAREADFNDPANPRRVQLALERLRSPAPKVQS